MSYSILDMRGLCIDSVVQEPRKWAFCFAASKIEKIMDNAEQRTLWTQAGALEVTRPKADFVLPETPFVIAHSDVEDGLYTQRDMIRIPLNATGGVVLVLQCEGVAEALRVEGEDIQLKLEGQPRYVRHLEREK